MNYGIKEIEEFKAPGRKPWLVLAVLVLLMLAVWQTVRILRSSAKKRADQTEQTQEAQSSAAAESSSVSAKKQPAQSAAISREQPQQKKAPVDLKAEEKPVPSANVSADIKRAEKLISKNDRVSARALLLAALERRVTDAQRGEIEGLLADLNVTLAFLPYDMPEKVDHVVQRGDSLDKISKKYGVTVESIQIGNDVKNPDLIKAGDHLRVLDADFAIEVHKGTHDLVLKMNGKFFKRYKVGLGKFDKTPLGTFEIYDRIVKPVWWRPDGREIPFGHEENILGTRWMAIRATGETPPVKGYGIHGTWNESSIGKSESAGCVRMRNTDVEEIFNLVPLGTKVTIRP